MSRYFGPLESGRRYVRRGLEPQLLVQYRPPVLPAAFYFHHFICNGPLRDFKFT